MSISTKNVLKLHLILIGFLFGFDSGAQNPYQTKSFADRLVFEGIVGVQFGTFTAIETSPMVGYKVTDDFVAGVGLTYQYSKYDNFYMNTENGSLSDRKINIFGGRLFTRYYFSSIFEGLGLLSGLFAHAEYEYLTYNENYKVDSNGKFVDVYGIPYSTGNEHLRVPGFLIGGGLNQSIGGRAYGSILILYNLNETNKTPYSNPVFRIGFGFGI